MKHESRFWNDVYIKKWNSVSDNNCHRNAYKLYSDETRTNERKKDANNVQKLYTWRNKKMMDSLKWNPYCILSSVHIIRNYVCVVCVCMGMMHCCKCIHIAIYISVLYKQFLYVFPPHFKNLCLSPPAKLFIELWIIYTIPSRTKRVSSMQISVNLLTFL